MMSLLSSLCVTIGLVEDTSSNLNSVRTFVPAPRLVGVHPNPGPNRQNNKNNQKMVNLIPRPLPFQATYRQKHMVRYITTTGGSNISFTRANFLNQLVVNTLTTANARIFSGVKLNKIEMFGFNNGNVANASTVSAEWTSTYGPSKIISDTSMGLEPAYIATSPPDKSLASFWSISGSNESDIIMILNYPASCVLNVYYEVIIANGEVPVSVTTTASGTIGTVYQLSLDQTSGNVVPVSYKTIT